MRMHRTLLAVVLLLAPGLSSCTGGDSSVAAGSPSVHTESRTIEPTAPSSPSPGTSESSSPETSPAPEPVIEDGRHFVFVEKVKTGSHDTVTFDLAYFLTGDEANQAAQDNGDEVPVPNDVYIVNDNPKLRTVAVADTAKILAIEWSRCCDAFAQLTFDEFAGYVAHPTEDFHGKLSPYWVRVHAGKIVKIQEQYLP